MDEIKTVADLLKKRDLDVLKAYLQWNVINTASSSLSDNFVAQNFDFYGRTLRNRKGNATSMANVPLAL